MIFQIIICVFGSYRTGSPDYCQIMFFFSDYNLVLAPTERAVRHRSGAFESGDISYLRHRERPIFYFEVPYVTPESRAGKVLSVLGVFPVLESPLSRA
jgi:hypothetical protein